MKSAVTYAAATPRHHRKKQCPSCGRVLTLDARTFVYATHPGTGKRLWKACRQCDRKRQAKIRAAVMADPVRADYRRKQHRDWQRVARAKNPERAREVGRRWRARLKETNPEHYVEILVIPGRFRKEGRSLARAHRTKFDAYRKPTRVEVVAPEPLLEFIGARFDGWESYEIAAMTGQAVSERWLSRLIRERPAVVELDAVDRFLTLGLGRPDLLNDLYPIAA